MLVILCTVIALVMSNPIPVTLPTPARLSLQQQQSAVVDVFGGLLPITGITIKNNNMTTDYCRPTQAQLFYEETNKVSFDTKQSQDTIHSFQDIKNMRSVLDMAYFNNTYYVLFENGSINLYDQAKQVGNMTHRTPINQGYLTQNTQYIVYVTESQSYLINNQITSYNIKFEKLNSAKLYGNTLLVAMGSHGISIYNTSSTAITLHSTHRIPDVIDMEYVNGSLFVLHPHVVKQYQLDTELVEVRQIYVGECQNMAMKNEYLFMTCPHLVRYNLNSKQIVTYDEIDIHPKDIIVTHVNGDYSIYLVGSVVIARYSTLNALSPLYMMAWWPIRVIMQPDAMFYVNDLNLHEVKLEDQYQKVECGAPVAIPQGIHRLQVSLIKACNMTFLREQGISQSMPDNSQCEYKALLEMNVWRERRPYWEVFYLLLAGCGILMALFCLWCCIKNVRIERQYNRLIEEGALELSQRSNQPTSIVGIGQ